jgi:hypothetical protein
MWGAAKHDRATGIHRPLRASVLLLAPLEGGERQFIIALDHCTMGSLEINNLLDAVCDHVDIKREELIIVFSHTHAAGLMGLERAHLPGGELIKPYLESVADKTIDLVREVLGNLQPATIIYGSGWCNLAAHRDFWDEKNQIWACGYDPVTPADETVLIAQAFAEDRTLLASLVNYACHPTTLAWDNTLISPDYPGAMRETIEAATGAPCLFLQGASGELGPVEGYVGDTSIADRNGRQLAYSALSTIESLPAPNTRFNIVEQSNQVRHWVNGNTMNYQWMLLPPITTGNSVVKPSHSQFVLAHRQLKRLKRNSLSGSKMILPKHVPWLNASIAFFIG